MLEAVPFPEARKPAYVLRIDFGPELGVRKSSAQITDLYRPEDLVGRLVVAVVNFPKQQIGPLPSEGLVTGFCDEHRRVALCVPEREVPLGTRLLQGALAPTIGRRRHLGRGFRVGWKDACPACRLRAKPLASGELRGTELGGVVAR